ncbi:hypothetical protein A2U01_0069878 [Trifolium medium]|uniref:Uncharacterized protein n=1 Tax=Trifolium medium TaxID=97028 RepID=A0A392SKZ6_9FABA|nr:hypothetical protein [Trifolium medium]
MALPEDLCSWSCGCIGVGLGLAPRRPES